MTRITEESGEATKRANRAAAAWLVVAAVLLQALTSIVGLQKEPNTLAAAILQAVTIGLGVAASYIFGKASAAEAARDIVRPHAVVSLRRAINLYRALDRQRQTLGVVYSGLKDEARPDGNGVIVVDLTAARWAIIGVQNVVIEQIGTAADAMEDWKDLAPEEVARFSLETTNLSAEEVDR